MSSDLQGFELPLRLLLGFRVLIDELHEELARQGHPHMQPRHGFVFQAVLRSGNRYGATAADLGRALGVSKQAAGKTAETLEGLGYLQPGHDPGDARRKTYTLTAHAFDALARSERIFDELRDRWAAALGEDRLQAMVVDLRKVTPPDMFRLDTPQWFNMP